MAGLLLGPRIFDWLLRMIYLQSFLDVVPHLVAVRSFGSICKQQENRVTLRHIHWTSSSLIEKSFCQCHQFYKEKKATLLLKKQYTSIRKKLAKCPRIWHLVSRAQTNSFMSYPSNARLKKGIWEWVNNLIVSIVRNWGFHDSQVQCKIYSSHVPTSFHT